MATNTTNLSLIKPAGTDKVRIAQINQNMDIIDAAIGAVGSTSLQSQVAAVASGLAIVSNNNTHAAIASGQYVYIRNHSSLSDGLYKANSAISANATLSTSNVTRVSSGGMNDLKEQIDSIDSQIAPASLGSLASISALTSALDTKLSSMGTYTNQEVRFTLSATSGAFRASTLYSGTLCKAGSNDNATLIVSTLSGGSGIPNTVVGQKTTTWQFMLVGNKIPYYTGDAFAARTYDMLAIRTNIDFSNGSASLDASSIISEAGYGSSVAWCIAQLTYVSTTNVITACTYSSSNSTITISARTVSDGTPLSATGVSVSILLLVM